MMMKIMIIIKMMIAEEKTSERTSKRSGSRLLSHYEFENKKLPRPVKS